MENEQQQPKIINHNEMQNCNVFMGDTYGGIFPLPGAEVHITQNIGPQKKSTQVSGEAETKEVRKMRKEAVMTAMGKRIDFEPRMLGSDDNRKRITNERIETLLRRCLGMGTIPPRDNHRAVMEQVWVLLMDERNQCHKEPGEPYFRQTVLNIIGYFVQKGLISGTPLDIARCVFSDADVSLAKNVSRGISSNVFPNLTDQLLDYYINQLQHGEF